MKATSWMARKIMTCYQLRRSVYYSVWPISIVSGGFEQTGRGKKKENIYGGRGEGGRK